MSDHSAFEDTLNFHIKFSKPQNFNTTGNNLQGIHTSVPIRDIESRGDQKPIVAVILGWFGAEYKHLAKYSEIYLDKGCIVLECVTPQKIVMHDKSKLPLVARRVLNLLEEHNLESNPIFFHALSNTGAWVYSYIVKELGVISKSKQLDIRGTIFDSCPFPLSAIGVYNTMIAHYSSSYLFGIKYPIAAAIAYFWSLGTFWRYNQLAGQVCLKGDRYDQVALVRGRSEPFPLYNWLPRICGVRNHAFLFLYSKADAITPWKEVEKIASTLKNRGSSVMLVKFPRSKHVAHLKEHHEEYSAAVSAFVLNQMESYSSDRPPTYWD